MNHRLRFNPAASGHTPVEGWKNRRDPDDAAWHWSSSTRQSGRAWRDALTGSAESATANTATLEAKP